MKHEEVVMGDQAQTGICAITHSEIGDCSIGSSANPLSSNVFRSTDTFYGLDITTSGSCKRCGHAMERKPSPFETLGLVSDHSQRIVLEQRYLGECSPAYNPAHSAPSKLGGVSVTSTKLERAGRRHRTRDSRS